MYLHSILQDSGKEGRRGKFDKYSQQYVSDSSDASGGVAASSSFTFHLHVNPRVPLSWHQKSNGSLRVSVGTELPAQGRTFPVDPDVVHRSPLTARQSDGRKSTVVNAQILHSTFYFNFYLGKKRDFSFVSPAKGYLCVFMCVCVKERERESRRERIGLRTGPIKGTKQAENESIDQSRGL